MVAHQYLSPCPGFVEHESDSEFQLLNAVKAAAMHVIDAELSCA